MGTKFIWALGARAAIVGDLDGDGDLDVLSASETDDKLAWHENLDGAGSFSAQRVISTAGDGRALLICDIKNDGLELRMPCKTNCDPTAISVYPIGFQST